MSIENPVGSSSGDSADTRAERLRRIEASGPGFTEHVEERSALRQGQTQVGIYRIECSLRRGGMGEVFLGWDDRLGRRVAIKRIRSESQANRRQRARLRREARAVARLNHPFIAQVYDVVFEDDSDSIVMEFVEGTTLGELLTSGQLDGALAINVAIQVSQGLLAAHQQGLVHRDLKASNIIVTPEGHAKILDFGLVKDVSAEETHDPLTDRGTLVGTVGSMSPEQASGAPVDLRSDLFSFGILLYEMFTGTSPFRRGSWVLTLEAIRESQPPPMSVLRSEVPEELSELVVQLLEKDPRRRPQTTREVVDALARLAGATRLGSLPPPVVSASGMPASSDATTGPWPRGDWQESSSLLAEGAWSRLVAWTQRLGPIPLTVIFLLVLVVATLGPCWPSRAEGKPIEPRQIEPRQIEPMPSSAEGRLDLQAELLTGGRLEPDQLAATALVDRDEKDLVLIGSRPASETLADDLVVIAQPVLKGLEVHRATASAAQRFEAHEVEGRLVALGDAVEEPDQGVAPRMSEGGGGLDLSSFDADPDEHRGRVAQGGIFGLHLVRVRTQMLVRCWIRKHDALLSRIRFPISNRTPIQSMTRKVFSPQGVFTRRDLKLAEIDRANFMPVGLEEGRGSCSGG